MNQSELSALVDEFYVAREERLELARQLAAADQKEKLLKEHIIRECGLAKLSAIGGQRAIVKLTSKQKPIVTNWNDVYSFIRKEDAFDLLQKRLTDTAVKLRWDDGIALAGIEAFTVYDLTVSKPK